MRICLGCGNRFQAEGWTCPACGQAPLKDSGYLVFAPDISLSVSYDPSYFSRLFRIEDGHWWFRSRRDLVVWALQRGFFPRERFLEVGCGTGFMILGIQEAFPDLLVFGSDLFVEGLAFAGQRLPRASLFQMDARRIPYEEEFDVVGAFDVLEHIDEDEEVLGQVFKAVRRGGGIILTVPELPCLWSEWDRYAHHKRRYTRGGLVQKVKKAGFGDIWCTSFVSLLLPAICLARFRRSHRDAAFDAIEELQVTPSVNRALKRLMALEFSMIRAGIRFPLGGSLLLTAQKA